MIINNVEFLSDLHKTDETASDLFGYHCILPYGFYQSIRLWWDEEERKIVVVTPEHDHALWLRDE